MTPVEWIVALGLLISAFFTLAMVLALTSFIKSADRLYNRLDKIIQTFHTFSEGVHLGVRDVESLAVHGLGTLKRFAHRLIKIVKD